jgi:hypothetical protein
MIKDKPKINNSSENREGKAICGIESSPLPGIWVSTFGFQVEVRYFMDGKAQKEYFFEDELTVLQ